MLLVPDGGGNSVQVGIGLVGVWGEEGLVGEGCHVVPFWFQRRMHILLLSLPLARLVRV